MEVLVKKMGTELYKASREGNTQYLRDLFLLDLSSNIDTQSSPILSQTGQKNNIIHIAAKLDHHSFILEVIHKYSFLVRQQNSKGDTPLHIASRFGHLNVVKLLIGQSNTQESLSSSARVSRSNPTWSNSISLRPLSPLSSSTGVSWSNLNGSNSVTLPSLSSSAGVTESSLNGSNSLRHRDIERGLAAEPLCRVKNLKMDTALHEALRNGRDEVAEYLVDVDPELACSVNLAGESPLFLAAESRCEGAMTKILELKLDFSIGGPHGQNPLHAARYCSETIIKLLLEKRPQLMTQPDEHGKTALHYAIEAYLLKTTKLLLKIDPSAAFVLDSEGFTPLLRASSMGWLQGFKAILKRCPESIETCDLNGRNALHLLNITRYTAGDKFLKIPELQELINERDNEGNTPMHLALNKRNHLTVRLLLETNGVDVRAINGEGLSALDISEQDWEESYKQRRMWHRLRKSKATRGRMPNQSKVPFKGPPNSEVHPKTDFKPMANTLSVVAALLATVTFAAAFTIPGGYNSNLGKNLGDALLVKKLALRVFVIADTFAMCSSITVVFFLIWAMIGEPDLLRTLVLISHIVITYSLYGTLIAFMSGLYAVLAPEALWVAILVCIMGATVPFVVSQRVIIASATGVWRTWHIK